MLENGYVGCGTLCIPIDIDDVVFETPNYQGGTLNLNQLHLHYKIMYLLDALSKAT